MEDALPYNRRIFWDVNFEDLHSEKDAAFIITRVFEKGDVEDIRNCRKYYSDRQIRESLLNTRYLSKHRLYLASAVIDEPLTAFRCYQGDRNGYCINE